MAMNIESGDARVVLTGLEELQNSQGRHTQHHDHAQPSG